MRTVIVSGVLASFACFGAGAQSLGRVVVHAADNIYGAGQATAPGGGNVPTAVVTLGPGVQCVRVSRVTGSLTCSAASGCITLNKGANYNDADGVGGQQSPTSNTGTSLISGIKAPNEGYLVAVFIPPGGPAGAAPARLDFTKRRMTAFRKLSPLLDQTFFVGDGKAGDGSGFVQRFNVPVGAGALVFGISDTCQNGNGPPGCYFDNLGTFKVLYRLFPAACPRGSVSDRLINGRDAGAAG